MTGKIKLNAASGGGSVIIQAPSSSGNDRIITLPDIPNGTLLTNQSSGLGIVIQLINTAELSTFSTTSTNYVDITGATFNITPSSSSNKILFMFSCYWTNTLVSGSNAYVNIRTKRGTSNIYESAHSAESGSGGLQAKGTCNHIFIDEPSATGAITYKVQARVSNSNSTAYIYEARLMAFEVKQ